MHAMVLHASPAQGPRPLREEDVPTPEPGPGQVRLRVRTCGVCRTDLHIVDGELPPPRLPLILGHQIVGLVDQAGPGVTGLSLGDRVGVPWLAATCGRCDYCRSGRENLCPHARFTAYHVDGGFAEWAVAEADACLHLPAAYDDVAAAPLLCAGLIGLRALRMAGDARAVGLYGFGSAAHLVAQIAVGEGREVYAFTRPGDDATQDFAKSLGAVWSGGSDEEPPRPLDAALLFAPVGALVPTALAAVAPGGSVVCAGIHMSAIPSFPYALVWGERVLRSVANLTRRDGADLMQVIEAIPVAPRTTVYELSAANEALADLRAGHLEGSAVLRVAHPPAGPRPPGDGA